jgi:ABC-type dipeptide/oligopeptide/nickel transport system permease component
MKLDVASLIGKVLAWTLIAAVSGAVLLVVIGVAMRVYSALFGWAFS